MKIEQIELTLCLGIDDEWVTCWPVSLMQKLLSAFVVYCWFRRWPQKNNTITKQIKETTLPFILGHLLSIQKNNFHTRFTRILLQITLED